MMPTYVAFTYGDPKANNPSILARLSRPHTNGLIFNSASIPVPVGRVLSAGTIDSAYSEIIEANGGVAPFTFAVTSGSLPPGLSLNASTGVISGTPTTEGTFTFTVTATDSGSNSCNQSFSITIASSSGGSSGGNYGWIQ